MRGIQRCRLAAARSCSQAIAKAEAMRGSAARPVSAPMLCLCKSRGQERLATRMLFVHRGSHTGDDAHGCSRAEAGVIVSRLMPLTGTSHGTSPAAHRSPRSDQVAALPCRYAVGGSPYDT